MAVGPACLTMTGNCQSIDFIWVTFTYSSMPYYERELLKAVFINTFTFFGMPCHKSSKKSPNKLCLKAQSQTPNCSLKGKNINNKKRQNSSQQISIALHFMALHCQTMIVLLSLVFVFNVSNFFRNRSMDDDLEGRAREREAPSVERGDAHAN